MIELKKKGVSVLFYENIKDMPVRRYQQSNKYMMIASDIGSDFADFDKRSLKTIEFLKKGMLAEAIQEIENRRMSVWNAYKCHNPKTQEFALMVKSIDGKPCNDITDEGLSETIKKLNSIGVTYNDMIQNLSEVKKKSKFSLNRIFQAILKRTQTLNTIFI